MADTAQNAEDSSSSPFRTFIGRGSAAELKADERAGPPWNEEIGPWLRKDTDDPKKEFDAPDHPAGYVAQPELAEAVNTAIILGRPLLLTGRPGTGKSQLAERIAWEFNLSPVLRFEAQSMSEAKELFYRFDLIAQLAAVEMLKARAALSKGKERATLSKESGTVPEIGSHDWKDAADPRNFLVFGPLGLAILRACPAAHEALFRIALPHEVHTSATPGRPSVVLIDEIDKASRDFPNDLLNGVERLEFTIRELGNREVGVPDDVSLRPIVIITSNSERDLPDAFLRRCVYFHIEDPDKDTLRTILEARVFPETLRGHGPRWREPRNGAGGPDGVPPDYRLYEDLLDFFVRYRGSHGNELQYQSGTSELIDWAKALRRDREVRPSEALGGNLPAVQRAIGAFAKHKDDRARLWSAISARRPA